MVLKLRTEKSKYVIDYKAELDADTGERSGEVLAKFYVERPLPTESKKMIDDNTVKKWLSPDKKTKKELHQDIDFLGLTYDRIDLIIVDWEGIVLTDKAGNITNEDPECNRANKHLVFENNPDVINYVLDESSKIFDLDEYYEKDKEKNLESGQSGTETPTEET